MSIAYESSAGSAGEWTTKEDLSQAMTEALLAQRRDERRRGVTLVGPHRDDLTLLLDGRAARIYASHGESWSLALALQLASFHVLHRIGDDPPVLILDDVFAELDEQRRERLLDAVTDAEQIIVTAAVGADVPARLSAQTFHVSKSDGQSSVGA